MTVAVRATPTGGVEAFARDCGGADAGPIELQLSESPIESRQGRAADELIWQGDIPRGDERVTVPVSLRPDRTYSVQRAGDNWTSFTFDPRSLPTEQVTYQSSSGEQKLASVDSWRQEHDDACMFGLAGLVRQLRVALVVTGILAVLVAVAAVVVWRQGRTRADEAAMVPE